MVNYYHKDDNGGQKSLVTSSLMTGDKLTTACKLNVSIVYELNKLRQFFK